MAAINKYLYRSIFLIFILVLLAPLILTVNILAQEEPGNFSLQVTPSPIVETIKPGDSKTIELKIRNNGNKTENLKIESRDFSLKNDSEEIVLADTSPSEVANWITFNDPKFTILPGEWYTERITINVPKNAGFSYSFALVISRVQNASAKPGTPAIKGSVAVFTLINIDRPDAKKQLSVASFYASKKVYEYLPAEFTTKFKNSGNTIVQPYGNIYIQRTKDSLKPISILPVNEGKGYILPGTERSLKTNWTDGFPVYLQTKNPETGANEVRLVWDWSKLNQFRFGKYYAKLVAVYNDGQRDVPLEGVISFWVIPWKFILVIILILALLTIGVVTVFKKIFGIKKTVKKNTQTDD